MPEFFFHISVELFADIQPTAQAVDTAYIGWPSGSQALSPFLSSKGQSAPPRDRSIDALRSSQATGKSPSTIQGNGQPAGRVDFVPDEYQTNTLSASRTASGDKRLDHIFIESTNTVLQRPKASKMNGDNHISRGIGTSANGLQTKGRYEPLDRQVTDSVWGIVHLYRDADETPGLYGDSLLSQPSNPWYSRAVTDSKGTTHPAAADQDCTTLCILAVPSYLAPSDFLGFVGEETREQVSHFRMIRTARANRYMVLIKFRDGKVARKWQKTWNGKVFNSMEVQLPLHAFPFLRHTNKVAAGDVPCRIRQVGRDHHHHSILS
jgi:BRCA1-associated protein